jgi:hypothetical protein
MAKETKNNNLGSFVDALTPEPKVITEDFIDFQRLAFVLEKSSAAEKSLIERMLDMVLACDRQKKFLSLGEQFAFNTLAKQKIIV